jgi:hypothetical protein
MMLEGAIKVLNNVWKDTITGMASQLGYLFLTDLLTNTVIILFYIIFHLSISVHII